MAPLYRLFPLDATRYAALSLEYGATGTFLQSPAWGRTQAALGDEWLRYGVERDGEMLGVFQGFVITARRGRICLFPHLQLGEDMALYSWLMPQLQQVAREQRSDVLRVSPLLPPSTLPAWRAMGSRDSAVYQGNPERTFVVDITGTEEEILARCGKQTRYDIRRSQRPEKGLQYQQGNTPELFAQFWALHQQTATRNGFTPFPERFTLEELAQFGPEALLHIALYEGQPVAAALLLYDDHSVYYHQAASLPCPEPAPTGLIWQAVLEARRRGIGQCNLWGGCAETDTRHPWYGLTRFKMGFGPVVHEYLHAQDFPLSGRYWLLTRPVEWYRRWRRGY